MNGKTLIKMGFVCFFYPTKNYLFKVAAIEALENVSSVSVVGFQQENFTR